MFLHGRGTNGKLTFLEILVAAFGCLPLANLGKPLDSLSSSVSARAKARQFTLMVIVGFKLIWTSGSCHAKSATSANCDWELKAERQF